MRRASPSISSPSASPFREANSPRTMGRHHHTSHTTNNRFSLPYLMLVVTSGLVLVLCPLAVWRMQSTLMIKAALNATIHPDESSPITSTSPDSTTTADTTTKSRLRAGHFNTPTTRPPNPPKQKSKPKDTSGGLDGKYSMDQLALQRVLDGDGSFGSPKPSIVAYFAPWY
jgi:hypothetical protein